MKGLLVLAASGVVGGLIGESRVMCPDGVCPITGSWMGGAVIGVLLGWALFSGVMAMTRPVDNPRNNPPSEPEA